MKILKTFIQGKYNDVNRCEDAIFINDSFVAVMDGVTSKSNFSYKNMTSGKLAVQLITQVLQTISYDATLDEIIREINNQFDWFYNNHDFELDKQLYGLQAAMVIYSDYHKEIYMIGDCQAVVNGKAYTQPKVSDEILAAMRSLIVHVQQDKGIDTEKEDLGRSVILPWIIESARFANCSDSPFGYSVINGETIPMELIQCIPVSRGDIITLASDGYPKIGKDFNETEKELKELIDKDPQLINDYPSTKGISSNQVSYDDRAYVLFEITSKGVENEEL